MNTETLNRTQSYSNTFKCNGCALLTVSTVHQSQRPLLSMLRYDIEVELTHSLISKVSQRLPVALSMLRYDIEVELTHSLFVYTHWQSPALLVAPFESGDLANSVTKKIITMPVVSGTSNDYVLVTCC
jgi:hypothetical protein